MLLIDAKVHAFSTQYYLIQYMSKMVYSIGICDSKIIKELISLVVTKFMKMLYVLFSIQLNEQHFVLIGLRNQQCLSTILFLHNK